MLMAGLMATEGADQSDANLPNNQNRMLDELLPLNAKTVVVFKDGNPVLMPWIDEAPGSARGVESRLGRRARRRRPPVRCRQSLRKSANLIPRSADDTLYAGRPERYPGIVDAAGYPVIRYSEGLEMGYRWFQARRIEPLFGFGFGLSYTTFDITDVTVVAPDGPRP